MSCTPSKPCTSLLKAKYRAMNTVSVECWTIIDCGTDTPAQQIIMHGEEWTCIHLKIVQNNAELAK